MKKSSSSNRRKFEKFVRSAMCLKKDGKRKSAKTGSNYGSHVDRVNILLGEEKDKGIYLLKDATQFERKINRLIRERKLPYRKSQPAINSANQSFIKYLKEKSK